MKKLLALTLALVLCLGLAACGGGTSTDTDTNADTSSDADTNGDATANGETITLTVGATPNPHAEILAQVKDDLAAEGIDLVVKEYSDYVVPNTAVEEGDLDANYFQHTPYMEKFNEENGTHLVSVGKIHYEPMGIYPGLTKTLEELPDGATIAVPNDATNEARALQLLAAQGLIELKEDAGLNATPNDITSNPKNLQFKELEAAMLPQTASEVDLSVINSNFAMEGGMNPATDSLASEDADSEAAQTFANIIAVKEGHENDPAIQALVKALQSDKVKEYIEKTYSGAVVAVF
ncbi:MetQ/NlpA family ABC transporter substrate-binding protein [Evtepia sp.]|uniref:MetQ/NlpA family ABC transporter substrate-binding protein n=1 Tax=Evtepia sp. TaxID=2773933 RepID=UPI001D7EEA0B|nr:MetQ/NlpA family ABC transporter substrate-binding protein [Evtepia sp.]MBD9248212.1 ABC transporter substrate-binding protein [Clostridiales bacterium]MEE0257632.1 MetQ/NlpA family ABC transporter substrate-binding protein [Evtepia sp.]